MNLQRKFSALTVFNVMQTDSTHDPLHVYLINTH